LEAADSPVAAAAPLAAFAGGGAAATLALAAFAAEDLDAFPVAAAVLLEATADPLDPLAPLEAFPVAATVLFEAEVRATVLFEAEVALTVLFDAPLAPFAALAAFPPAFPAFFAVTAVVVLALEAPDTTAAPAFADSLAALADVFDAFLAAAVFAMAVDLTAAALSSFGSLEYNKPAGVYAMAAAALSATGRARAETKPAERATRAKMDPKFFMMKGRKVICVELIEVYG